MLRNDIVKLPVSFAQNYEKLIFGILHMNSSCLRMYFLNRSLDVIEIYHTKTKSTLSRFFFQQIMYPIISVTQWLNRIVSFLLFDIGIHHVYECVSLIDL